jgi:hypothetical protein
MKRLKSSELPGLFDQGSGGVDTNAGRRHGGDDGAQPPCPVFDADLLSRVPSRVHPPRYDDPHRHAIEPFQLKRRTPRAARGRNPVGEISEQANPPKH